jgi:hypothetical protein
VRRLPRASVGLLLLACVACGSSAQKAAPARREFQQFQREVYPVMLRDCGFPACHGAPKRFFRVWGPGRTRMPGMKGTPAALDLPTVDEISSTYSLALSMIDDSDPAHSMLLRKPLAVAAGGAGHLGVDKHGRDVYRTTQDTGYVAIARWVLSPPPAAMPPPTPAH